MLTPTETVFWSSNARTTDSSVVTVSLPRPTQLTSITIVVTDKCQPESLVLSLCPEGSAEYVEMGVLSGTLLNRSLRVPLSYGNTSVVSAVRLQFQGFAEANKERMHGITFLQLREKAKGAVHCSTPQLLNEVQEFLLSICTTARSQEIKDQVRHTQHVFAHVLLSMSLSVPLFVSPCCVV